MDEPFSCPGCYKSECICWELERAKENWDLITTTMHPSGPLYSRLNLDQDTQIRLLADGLGRLFQDEAELSFWEHIQDSSLEAKEQMAAKIREFLNKEASPT